MLLGELAALGAALCWALGGVVAVTPIRQLGPLPFNRVRMALVFLMLATTALFTGGWREVSEASLKALMLSGLVGIFLGDTALFASLQRLGPSRSAVVFALNAPMTVILGWVVLEEHLQPLTLFGCLLVPLGVMLAILGRSRVEVQQNLDSPEGRLWHGIALGLLAALGQAVGSIIARPVMASGMDPATASALRVGTAALGLLALGFLPNPIFHAKVPFTRQLVGRIVLSGFLGMGLGMTLLLFALSQGDAGVVATLSATTPVLILPLLWWRTGVRPPGIAWSGAAVAVVGTALIAIARA
ncbi:MAG: DMT family transporter [bacterium]|jgi:drug/metabolite transporter (DMT)-like permease